MRNAPVSSKTRVYKHRLLALPKLYLVCAIIGSFNDIQQPTKKLIAMQIIVSVIQCAVCDMLDLQAVDLCVRIRDQSPIQTTKVWLNVESAHYGQP